MALQNTSSGRWSPLSWARIKHSGSSPAAQLMLAANPQPISTDTALLYDLNHVPGPTFSQLQQSDRDETFPFLRLLQEIRNNIYTQCYGGRLTKPRIIEADFLGHIKRDDILMCTCGFVEKHTTIYGSGRHLHLTSKEMALEIFILRSLSHQSSFVYGQVFNQTLHACYTSAHLSKVCDQESAVSLFSAGLRFLKTTTVRTLYPTTSNFLHARSWRRQKLYTIDFETNGHMRHCTERMI